MKSIFKFSLILSLILFSLIESKKLRNHSQIKEDFIPVTIKFKHHFIKAYLLANLDYQPAKENFLMFQDVDGTLSLYSQLFTQSQIEKGSSSDLNNLVNQLFKVLFDDIKSLKFDSNIFEYLLKVKLNDSTKFTIYLENLDEQSQKNKEYFSKTIFKNFENFLSEGNVFNNNDNINKPKLIFKEANTRNLYFVVSKESKDHPFKTFLNCEDKNWNFFSCCLSLEEVDSYSVKTTEEKNNVVTLNLNFKEPNNKLEIALIKNSEKFKILMFYLRNKDEFRKTIS